MDGGGTGGGEPGRVAVEALPEGALRRLVVSLRAPRTKVLQRCGLVVLQLGSTRPNHVGIDELDLLLLKRGVGLVERRPAGPPQLEERRALLLVLVLPACADSPGPARIECRTNEDAAFERVCLLEGREDGQGGAMIVRRPDGGFRRFALDPEGRHMTVDGADEMSRTYDADNDRAEFAVDGDRYSVPLSLLPRQGDE